MGRQIKTKAVVLHEMPIGDYDKRLILLTKEEGKVTAFVKGARRPNSPMLAASQLFAYGDYVLNQGKSSYQVYQANLIKAYHELSKDMEDLTYGMYMLEFIDHVAKEEEDNRALMQWLLMSLKVLESHRISNRLAVRIFELKAMSILGFTPWLNDCLLCHREEVVYFSPGSGGVICARKDHEVDDLLRVHAGVLQAMRHILSREMKDIYSFELEHPSLLEFEQVMTQFLWHNLNHRFKSMEFLREFK